MSLAAGASVLYDEPLTLNKLRDDLIFYSVPFDKMVAPSVRKPSCASW